MLKAPLDKKELDLFEEVAEKIKGSSVEEFVFGIITSQGNRVTITSENGDKLGGWIYRDRRSYP